ncbi:hypothetical protein BKA61DRAFT_213709 [Leptodontidium sp. MPI-SDFR-AT-0119]|nr:hypothetical protein BKA61DRAFT_213709 [Leptodontidium sp. MPI-SDFR-AT-0119]
MLCLRFPCFKLLSTVLYVPLLCKVHLRKFPPLPYLPPPWSDLSITFRWFIRSRRIPHKIMAPIIQIPVEDTLKTLRHVLKRRADANRVLKERERSRNFGFLPPLESDNTKPVSTLPAVSMRRAA